jgi:hypothetical protein
MNNREFYSALANLPQYYDFNLDGSNITGEVRRGKVKGLEVNPVTAVANRLTGGTYGTNKRETQRAARDIGLDRDFTNHIYNAATGVSNRGNTQVVRGKIRSALGV